VGIGIGTILLSGFIDSNSSGVMEIIQFFISIFEEIIDPQALLYIVILVFLAWIKFNDLHDINIWQAKHEKRSEQIWKKVNKHGEDIEGLKKGKADK